MLRDLCLLAVSAIILLAGTLIGARHSALAGTSDGQLIERGRILFEQRWTVAPSGLGRWGRGPTSNGEACIDCHADTGRGAPPEASDEPLRQGVLRLTQHLGTLRLPHPAYGHQLQYQGVLGKVPGEGEVYIDWHEHALTLADGARVILRRPHIRLSGLAFGELGEDTLKSLRLAPALSGLGLLEGVSEATLRRIAGNQVHPGVSGRLNTATDPHTGATFHGRFGHKASQPNLRAQTISALHMDLGITSARFPDQNCPPLQWECLAQPASAAPEISEDEIDALVTYLRAIPAPPRMPSKQATRVLGERMFRMAGCNTCHVAALESGPSRTAVDAYSDLLLHDLGEGLSDGRPDAGATGREWRTAPLWGIGAYLSRSAQPALMHDGRARTLQEAILWHDGEARRAREAYARMPKASREALVAFVESL